MAAQSVPDVGGTLPPYLIPDLMFSIAMFVIGIIGLRFTLQYLWSIDILDFSTLPAQIAGGVAGLITPVRALAIS